MPGFSGAASGPAYPSSTNVFVPDHEASGRLSIGYSRNAKQFLLPRIVKYIEAKLPVGMYRKRGAQEAARHLGQASKSWPSGQPRPRHAEGLEQFQYLYFQCLRNDYGCNVPFETRNNASWPLMEEEQQGYSSQLMVHRTKRFWDMATATASWTKGSDPTINDPDLSADHAGTATAFVGGFLDQGTSSQPLIKTFFNRAEALVNLDTLAVVDREKMVAIINPNTARLWSEGSEIHEFIKGSYWAREELDKNGSPNNKYGLNSSVYGQKIEVEPSVMVTSPKGVALAKSLIFPDQTVLIVSRIGALEGVMGSSDFTTLTMFWNEDEMTVETFDHTEDRFTTLHITENTDEVLTSPLSGFLLTAANSKAS